jgi:4-hydroxy-2-oxovalerate aldolase
MKSYAVSPGQFAEQVKLSESYGADMIYIVDSAGGMFPEDIRKYYEAVRNVTAIPIGFHGHDNLGMAVSNSVEAALSGAHFVDSSLQGLGRSAGNASTEQLVLSLLKKGFDVGVDFIRVLKLGEKYIQPLLPNKGKMPLDLISGFADFHSSYMHHIEKASSKHNVDPARLIIEMCTIDKVNLDVHILEEVATKMRTGAPNLSTQGDTYMTRGIAEIAAERSQAISPHISPSITDDDEEIGQGDAVVG